MHVEHSKRLFFKAGPAKGIEQWKLFNFSKLQSLYLKEQLLQNGIHLFAQNSTVDQRN